MFDAKKIVLGRAKDYIHNSWRKEIEPTKWEEIVDMGRANGLVEYFGESDWGEEDADRHRQEIEEYQAKRDSEYESCLAENGPAPAREIAWYEVGRNASHVFFLGYREDEPGMIYTASVGIGCCDAVWWDLTLTEYRQHYDYAGHY